MPLLFTCAVNARFRSRDDGTEHESAEAALAKGIEGALALAGDEIGAGDRASAVEISIEDEHGTVLLRSIVTVSVARLMTATDPDEG